MLLIFQGLIFQYIAIHLERQNHILRRAYLVSFMFLIVGNSINFQTELMSRKLIFIFSKSFYSFERQRERNPCSVLHSQMHTQQLRQGQAKTRNRELNCQLSDGCQASNHLSQFHCLPRCILAESWDQRQDFNLSIPMWNIRIPAIKNAGFYKADFKFSLTFELMIFKATEKVK